MMKRTLVFSALWTLGIGAALLPSLGCSGAPREEKSSGTSKAPDDPTAGPPPPAEGKAPAPAESKAPAPPEGKAPAPGAGTKTAPEATRVPHDPTPTVEATVPSSGPVEPQGGPERILPATKRSAAGLPDVIAGYISWFRLGPSPTPEQARNAHAPARQAYVLFPKQENHNLGGTVNPPFEKGTTIVLEEKEPGKDFISRVRTMTVEESGWKFADYARAAGDKPFAPRAGTEAECAACHAKAKDSDSVYSNRKLE